MIFNVLENGCVSYTVRAMSPSDAEDLVRRCIVDGVGEKEVEDHPEDYGLEVEQVSKDEEVSMRFECGPITLTAEQWDEIFSDRQEVLACSEW